MQDVVTAENMVYEKFSNWNRDINNADAEAIEEAKRVRDMAAQVAVQKTVEAGKVKTQTGAMWSLDSTGRELSNAQQEAKVSYSLNDNNSTGIKQQLQNHLDELNAMEPVVTIKSQAYVFKNKSDLRKQLTQEFEKSGAIVDRQGFGKVIFDETAMSQIVGYISLSDTAGLLAIKAAPAVAKRGRQIDYQSNFKNRGFDTVTFAAPVKINGTRGNVAVVVRMIKSNRANCVRIVLPDGSAFKIDNEKADTMSGSGLENQVQKRNGSAYKNNIPQSEQNVKKNFSLNDKQKNDFRFSLDDSTGRELSEGQREYFKDSVIRDEQGRLKVMYRGGRESFTVFDRKKASHSNLYGRGFYFTDSESHARQYGDARAYYLKVTNPVSTEQTTITRAQLRKFIKAVAQNEDYGLDNYGYGATVDSVLKKVYGSRSDFAMLYDIDTVCVGDMVATVELFNEVNGTNYDGFILPTETVVFSSEQIKDIDNLNPTSDSDIRYSLDRDLLRELDGYNTHGDAMGKQGKAVEKMFVQAFKEAKQDSNASLEVYADTLVAFDNLLPKLRKFVDGTLTEKSTEKLTDELVGIVDKALDRAKGEKKAHPLIESYVGGAITLSPLQAKELKSLGYSVIQYQAMLTKALGYRAHVGVAKSVADMPFGSTLEQGYQLAYDETGDESYNVTAVGLRFGKYEFVPLLGKIYVISCPVG